MVLDIVIESMLESGAEKKGFSMKVLVILSGGMDSTTVLYKAVKDYGVENIIAASFKYGSRHNEKEIPMARTHTHKLGVEHHIINLEEAFANFKSNLLKGQGEIPEGHYAAANMSQTVVPNRNMIMLSIAGGLADSKGCSEIWLGSHAGDHAVYPDCRVEFTQAVSEALSISTEGRVKIVSPFNEISKSEIVKLGLDLGVDYKYTWSCYKGEDQLHHCYKCGTCVERVETFIENNLMDPAAPNTEVWAEAVKNYFKVKEEFKTIEEKK